jgi:hypothetical protein
MLLQAWAIKKILVLKIQTEEYLIKGNLILELIQHVKSRETKLNFDLIGQVVICNKVVKTCVHQFSRFCGPKILPENF